MAVCTRSAPDVPALVVVRHAKADRPTGVDDIDRPLLPRGREQARATGRWLQETVGRPGLLVTSPALRATQTVDGLLTAYADDPPPVVQDESVYEASVGDLLRVVRSLDDDEDVVVLVGHNPGVSDLVTELTGSAVDLSTAGATVLDVPSPWADTPPGACRVRASNRS
jgi:phosphohistidine phosphatase